MLCRASQQAGIQPHKIGDLRCCFDFWVKGDTGQKGSVLVGGVDRVGDLWFPDPQHDVEASSGSNRGEGGSPGATANDSLGLHGGHWSLFSRGLICCRAAMASQMRTLNVSLIIQCACLHCLS